MKTLCHFTSFLLFLASTWVEEGTWVTTNIILQQTINSVLFFETSCLSCPLSLCSSIDLWKALHLWFSCRELHWREFRIRNMRISGAGWCRFGFVLLSPWISRYFLTLSQYTVGLFEPVLSSWARCGVIFTHFSQIWPTETLPRFCFMCSLLTHRVGHGSVSLWSLWGEVLIDLWWTD